ncbi:BMP family ABC transporter substrate-binding protein [Hoeflea sp. TYP-13]|uniref:BMP family ABC transporter substrate-binding protein n=1 Tax=Hoeflea sp. TYP-13 TaxID=3230023 RepID=UPI0034C695B0
MAVRITGTSLTRRDLLKGSATLGATSLANGLVATRPASASSLTVGMVYIGHRYDWGWNQAQSLAADVLKSAAHVKVVQKPALPEEGEFTKSWNARYNRVIEALIEEGANLVISTSFGDDPDIAALAGKYPDVFFRNVTTDAKTAGPVNFGSQYSLINQGHYVNGVAAGLCTGTNKLGFVAGKPEGAVLANINSFLIGVRQTNPDAVVKVMFTRQWTTTPRDSEITNALVDDGCDVITCTTDSPETIIKTAADRGAMVCGHAFNQEPLAPNGYITGAEHNWFPMFAMFVKMREEDRPLPDFVSGGYDRDYVTSSPFGAGATPQAINAAQNAIQAMKNGKAILVGPIKDNRGRIVVPAGTTYGPYAQEVLNTDYLVEGVIGSIT